MLGAQSARIAVVELGESVKEARSMVSEIGEAMVAAFAVDQIVEFANRMGEAAEKTVHTAETFGLTASEVQKMNAQAALFGVPADAMATAMMRLDKSFQTAKEGATQQANAYKEIGVDLKGSYTQTQLMEAALAGLGNMAAGPAKVAAAMAIFGRNIQQIGPLLGITTQQIAEANETIAQYGAVNDVAVAKGLALAESQNTTKVAMQGLNNVLTDALAPSFKNITDALNAMIGAFTRSYNEGGAVKIMMDGLVIAIKAIESALIILSEPIVLIWQVAKMNIEILADAVVGVWNLIKAMAEWVIHNYGDVGETFRFVAKLVGEIGTAIQGVLPVVEGAVKVMIGWFESLAQTVGKFLSALPGVGPQFAKMGADAKRSLDEIRTSALGAGAALQKVWAPDVKAPLPAEGTGTTASDADAKAKKAKAARDQDYLDKVAHDQEMLAEDRDNYAKEMADFDAYLADVKAKYGDQSPQYQKVLAQRATYDREYWDGAVKDAIGALDEIIKAKTKEIDEEAKAQERGQTEQLSATKASIEAQIGAVKERYQAGEIGRSQEWSQIEALHAQEAQAELQEAAAIYNIQLQAINAKIALNAGDLAAEKTLAAQKAALWSAYYSDITKLAANADKQQLADQTAAMKEMQAQVAPYVSAFDQGMLQMAEGAKSFQQVMASIGSKILNDIVSKLIDPMVTKWVAGLAAQLSATIANATGQRTAQAAAATSGIAINKTAAIADITTSAGEAFAAAYAAIAGIPIVGPELAPAAAATAYAGAMGGLGLASAAGGYDIPSGVNPIVQTHANEMILPATYANPLRSMLKDFSAANFNAPAAGNDGGAAGGAVHFHIHGAMDGPSFQDFLESRQDHFQGAFETMARGGKFSKFGIGR